MMGGMVKLALNLLKLVGVLVVIVAATSVNEKLGVLVALIVLAYGGVSILKPLPGLGRGLAVAVALIGVLAVAGVGQQRHEPTTTVGFLTDF